MMDTLEELQYIPIKDDIRQRIAAFFGVSNVFMNDVTGGGLNNEGMQIVVSNRSVAYAQSIYNNVLFPALAQSFSVTEWHLKLSPHEEEDEIMNMRRDEMAIRNMMQMKQAGFEATLRDGIDDTILHFDFKQPDPAELAAAQQAAAEAAQAQQAQGGQPVQKGVILEKRSQLDANRGGSLPVPSSIAVNEGKTDLPVLRTVGEGQHGSTRNSGGYSPVRLKRHEGAPAGAESKTDKRQDKSIQESMTDKRLSEMSKRKGLGGQS